MEKGSGLYAIVWRDAEKETPEEECLLRKTCGGWSHITISYCGNDLSMDELRRVLRDQVGVVGHEVSIVGYHPNVFVCRGRLRYDVLLDLDDETTALIERVRTELPATKYSQSVPHITWSVSWDAATHARDLERIDKLLQKGPQKATITGLTID